MKTLNLAEAAEFLHAGEETVREKAVAGEIPGAKIGRAWVFIDIDLAEYLRAQYGGKKEETCHFTSAQARRSGGLSSGSTESEYRKALELPTGQKQKNSRQSLKLVSTTSKD